MEREIFFIFKSEVNTSQFAVADLKRLKMPITESEKFCGKYSTASYKDSKSLGIFFIFAAIFLVLFSILPVSALNLEVSQQAVSDTVVSEINEPAVFNLTIKNLGKSDDFEIYSLVGIDIRPKGMFHLDFGEIKTIETRFYLDETLRKNSGILNFVYKIRGADSGIQDYTASVTIANFKDAIEIGAYNFAPDSSQALVYVQNNLKAEFSKIDVNLKSVFFEKAEEFSLKPLEKREISIPFDRDKTKGILAGTYLLTGSFQVGDFKQDLEGEIKYLEKADISEKKSGKGIIFREKIITKTNDGNIPVLAEIQVSKDIISRLFTRFGSEPSRVERNWLVVRYTWNRELKPSESIEVKVSTNYLYPLIMLLCIVIIAYLIYRYTSSDLVLRKRVNFVRTKGGEFALKVSLNVSARKFVEKISITDRFPGIVKLYERFGAYRPDKIDEAHKRLVWNIESLQPREERVFSYIIYSKVGVVGRFELPATLAVYERDGKLKETTSNRAFFMNETRRSEDD